MYCQYYQADVNLSFTWFVTGVLRSEDNMVFDRAQDGNSRVLEFFVPVDYEDKFLSIMQYLQQAGYITKLEKKENRFKTQV